MFEQILTYRACVYRHRSGPYGEERERYLALISEEGRSHSTLLGILNLLYAMAEWLPMGQNSITPSQIQAIAKRWSATLRCSEKCRHRAAAATGSEIVCPVLMNRAPARYRKLLAESALIVVDGCSTRCASRLAAGHEAKVDRKILISDAAKASGVALESSLSPGPAGLALAQLVVDDLVRSLNAPAASLEPDTAFEAPTEYLVVSHDKFEFRIPAVDYLFNENDVWIRVLEGVARVGISDYMQQSLTDINFFDPPKPENVVEQFGELGSLESAKAVFEVIAPAGGAVAAVNSAVVASPGLINEDPYGAGWLVEIRLTHWLEDRGLLQDGAAYAETVKRKAEEA